METRAPGRGFLSVIGAINWDVTIFEDRFPRVGEEVQARLVEEYPGGKGANVAVAAARVLGAGRVSLVGALGDDDVSERQLAGLRAEGVLTGGVSTLTGSRSGMAYIVVDERGRKTIHTQFGANGELTPAHLAKENVARLVSRSSMIVVMDPPTSVALAAVSRAKERWCRVVYSPGVRAQEGLRRIGPVIRRADILVVDSSELKNLAGLEAEDPSLEALSNAFPRVTVVVTLGAKGCVVSRGTVKTVLEGVDLAALGLRAVNSTGSGDAFLGVLASYLTWGKTVEEAASWANLAGALKAARYETRGSPGAKELEDSMGALGELRRRPRGSPGSRAS
ncbi:MAG: PfkB family carbohydrate kinase [Thaumarchaeota archaeon]|nr:PfkB family carbohydrate kinase [Nitrososphaerota archaeon]